ncbi:MAG: peptidoglycan-binding domain-containing protein, partial [Candidatus Vogelbacteria bacterium]|nr:peptidoglycan-binding domain-containing protein [Candidatus Vogelbacteria bacterium]
MKKITSLVVALLLVVGVAGALTASAATTAELQAMIAQLQAQLSALTGGSTSVGGTAFTQNLTVGSRGAEVSALQEVLNTEVDAGLPITGYFGGLTKAAVIKFQKANGISGTGYVGPLTRAALNDLQAPADNGNGTGSTVPGCAAGALFSATTGASCTTAD